MPSTRAPSPLRTASACIRRATSRVSTGRTHGFPAQAGSVTSFFSSQALYPAAQPLISSFCSRLGPAGAGRASSRSTVRASRTPVKYRSLERLVRAEDIDLSVAAFGPKCRDRSPRTVTNPSASTHTWSAACAQPVPKPRPA